LFKKNAPYTGALKLNQERILQIIAVIYLYE